MSTRPANDAPFWWYRETTSPRARAIALALAPVSAIYSAVATRRIAQSPLHNAKLPVICVGNFTAGGTGKTPLVRAICEHLRACGHTPIILSRGYGGHVKGPHKVDATRDTARDVGDEPLLLARDNTVVISTDRAAGARFIENITPRPDVIVMDDGLQNPALAKDLTIAVVDRKRGTGNGRVIPSGPLRAPIAAQLAWTDVIAVVTPPDAVNSANSVKDFTQNFEGFHGTFAELNIAPRGDTSWLNGAKVIAYAGIGAPERFFSLIENLGGIITGRHAFSDHHVFTENEAALLVAIAAKHGATLVTTEKDAARLAGSLGKLRVLAEKSRTLSVSTGLPENLKNVIRDAIEHHRSLAR